MFIDYTSLIKAYPKDPFALPQIDQIIDSTSGCDLLCFLDAYSSFHQIPMSREDEEHTTLIIVDDLFCFVSMPYGLKNALPTFVRAMHKTFGDLIRDLIKVYVDDIVVKIKSHSSLLDNLAKVFDRLHSTHTILNLDKCVFGVFAWKLFGFLDLHRGIERQVSPGPTCLSARVKLLVTQGNKVKRASENHAQCVTTAAISGTITVNASMPTTHTMP
jgi:hypothetical protein